MQIENRRFRAKIAVSFGKNWRPEKPLFCVLGISKIDPDPCLGDPVRRARSPAIRIKDLKSVSQLFEGGQDQKWIAVFTTRAPFHMDTDI